MLMWLMFVASVDIGFDELLLLCFVAGIFVHFLYVMINVGFC